MLTEHRQTCHKQHISPHHSILSETPTFFLTFLPSASTPPVADAPLPPAAVGVGGTESAEGGIEAPATTDGVAVPDAVPLAIGLA